MRFGNILDIYKLIEPLFGYYKYQSIKLMTQYSTNLTDKHTQCYRKNH